MRASVLDLAPRRSNAHSLPSTTTICYPDGVDQQPILLCGTDYAQRCAAQIIHHNIPDALWALEVLNRFGHLVAHPADREGAR
jgi:hypothetical protein